MRVGSGSPGLDDRLCRDVLRQPEHLRANLAGAAAEQRGDPATSGSNTSASRGRQFRQFYQRQQEDVITATGGDVPTRIGTEPEPRQPNSNIWPPDRGYDRTTAPGGPSSDTVVEQRNAGGDGGRKQAYPRLRHIDLLDSSPMRRSSRPAAGRRRPRRRLHDGEPAGALVGTGDQRGGGTLAHQCPRPIRRVPLVCPRAAASTPRKRRIDQGYHRQRRASLRNGPTLSGVTMTGNFSAPTSATVFANTDTIFQTQALPPSRITSCGWAPRAPALDEIASDEIFTGNLSIYASAAGASRR